MLAKLKRMVNKNRKLYLKLGGVFSTYRNTVMRASRLLGGIDPELAVFSAFNYKKYNDNPRYISEALHERRPQTKIVWLFSDPEAAKREWDIPDYVTVYNSIGRKGVSALARARVVVDNFNKRFYLDFPDPRQIYFQAWHGDRAFKKIGFDHEGQHTRLLEEFASVSMTGSDYGDMQYRSAFHYKGRLLRAGYPRNDILLRDDPAEKAAIRRKLGIAEGERILLYAPTYRDVATHVESQQDVHMDLRKVLDTFERVTGAKWRCLVRAHYLSCGIRPDETDERMADVTAYPEMAELLCVADALISDYSSCAGDFALTRRPIFLYQDDLEDYATNNRALYFDVNDSPYLIAHTPAELDRLIEETTAEKARANAEAILDFYGATEDGHATQAAVDYIVARLGRENLKVGADEGLPDDDLRRPLTGSGRWRIPCFEGKIDDRAKPEN